MPARRMLLLQCRNYGDAVIGTGLVEALGRSVPGVELEVLTRPRFRRLYDGSPYVARVHEAEFPMGTASRFGAADALHLLQTVRRLRGERFDRVVNLCGDLRENALGWAISRRGNCSPLWPEQHPHRRLARQGLERLVPAAVAIPAAELNIYANVERVAAALGATAPARQRVYDPRGQAYLHAPVERAVGLHLSASQVCREWPLARWRALSGMILQQGWTVVAFCAPSERAALAAELGDLPGLELASGDTDAFFARLCRLAAFVGLDSFGIHAAHAIGVPSLMLNGANLAEAIKPPDARLVDGGIGVSCHPCYNKPTCTATAEPYRCIRAIAEVRVLRELQVLLADSG